MRYRIISKLKASRDPKLFLMYSRHKTRSSAERALKRIKKHCPEAFIHDCYAAPEWQASHS